MVDKKTKVLVVGWDAADWKVIHPLMDKGAMPHLKGLLEQGVMSEISTLHPVLSPMLWTSIGTGKRPFKHGVHGFIEPTPDGAGVQPVTTFARRTKAVWNILNQHDLRSLVVGWWPSHPAEPIDGVMVSNKYHQSPGLSVDDPWPMVAGTVHPAELSEELAELRMHPAEVTEELLLPFIPLAADVDQDKDRRLWTFAKIFAECNTVHAAATHLMETQDWNLMAVYYDAIDHLSHGFMKYHPPRQKQVSEQDFEIYQHVIQGAYIYHDMMLGRLLELAGDDAAVIIVSDHGFHPDHLRPHQIPSEPTGPAIEHRDFGVFAMRGPGVKKDALIHGVNLLDVTPTILSLFGLPIGMDMDGRVIADAFEEPVKVETVPSWDDIPGRDGQHPEGSQLQATESKEALQQLVDLGYIEALDEDQAKNVRRASNEMNFNLARSYMDAHRYGDALPLLYELYCSHPTEYRFGIQLAMCFKYLGRTADLGQLVANLEQQRVSDARKAQAELEKYSALAKERKAAREGQAADAGESGEADERDENLFSDEENTKISHLLGLTRINRFSVEFLHGIADVEQGDVDEGIERLVRAAAAQPNLPGAQIQLGDAYLRRRDWDNALAAFTAAWEMDSRNPYVLLGMARCHLGKQENELAVQRGLESVGQMFFNPLAHYYLGVAFHRRGELDRAQDALKLSIHQNPNNARAHGRLGYIYKNELDEPELALEHFKLAGECKVASRELRERASKLELPAFDEDNDDAVRPFAVAASGDEAAATGPMLPTLQQLSAEDVKARRASDAERPFVTVVSGLPRSGTSMMMQMLANGGMDVWSDGKREADEDNPRGYFELDDAKQLTANNAWIEQAQGKVIKVVAQLLPYLPKQFDYRVIMMDRAPEEVLASQKTMLSRSGHAGADLTDERLRSVFTKQMKGSVQLLRRASIPMMRVVYAQVLADPRPYAEQLQAFLGADLDLDKMTGSVDPGLHRHKKDRLKSA